MTKISLWVVLLSCMAACSDPRLLLHRSSSGKLIDTKPHSQNKRMPLYNKQYIELAKSRGDHYTPLGPDHLYDPEIVHQNIYNQMLDDEAHEQLPHLSDITSGFPSSDSRALQQDIAALKTTIEELRAELQLTKTLTKSSLSSMYIEGSAASTEPSADYEVITLLQAAGVYDDRLCSINEMPRFYSQNAEQ